MKRIFVLLFTYMLASWFVICDLKASTDERSENTIASKSQIVNLRPPIPQSYTHASPLILEREEWISHDIEDFDCHSSSIVETSPGIFCVVWKGGAGKGKSNISMTNVGIWASFFNGVWSAPVEIVNTPNAICWTPVLCKSSENELLLFYRIGQTPRTAISLLKRSVNHGHSWSMETILPAGIVGPTKNKPLLTKNGKLIIPSSVEIGSPEDLLKVTACWIEISDDNGYSWKKVGPLELEGRKFGVIEPVLFYDRNHHLRMMCRDRARRIGEIGHIWMATSSDDGLHWSKLEATPLPNPDSALDVVDLGSGRLILIYNHSHTDRYPLHMAFSHDGGDHWSPPLILDEEGEFPSAVLGSDGNLHITYAKRKSPNTEQRGIKYVVVNHEVLFSSMQTQH